MLCPPQKQQRRRLRQWQRQRQQQQLKRESLHIPFRIHKHYFICTCFPISFRYRLSSNSFHSISFHFISVFVLFLIHSFHSAMYFVSVLAVVRLVSNANFILVRLFPARQCFRCYFLWWLPLFFSLSSSFDSIYLHKT